MLAANHSRRHEIVAYYLFDQQCITGQQIARAFGDDLRRKITWEHPYGDLSDAPLSQAADLDHMRQVITKAKPKTVISFGVPEIEQIWDGRLILGPHPIAPRVDTERRLEHMASMAMESQVSEYAAHKPIKPNTRQKMPTPAQIAEETRKIRETWLPDEHLWRLQ